MKVGIFTLPLHTNYGGILQSYALQTVVERMGHEVVVYNRYPSVYVHPFWMYPLLWFKRLTLKVFFKRHVHVFQEQYDYKLIKIQNINTRKFVFKYTLIPQHYSLTFFIST